MILLSTLFGSTFCYCIAVVVSMKTLLLMFTYLDDDGMVVADKLCDEFGCTLVSFKLSIFAFTTYFLAHLC